MNDIILFPSNPSIAVAAVEEIFTRYGKFSGLRINFPKSEIHPLIPLIQQSWFSRVPFIVARDHVYLLWYKDGEAPIIAIQF